MKRLSKRKLRLWRADFLVNRSLWKNLALCAEVAMSFQHQERPKIFDIGCGNKPYKDFFENSIYIGMNYTIDGALPDLLGDAMSIPIKNDSFEIVLCTQVIEHVSEPIRMMMEISRVLKPGGFLILSGPFYWPIHEEPYDYYRYSKYGMKYLVQNAGLDLQIGRAHV